jgi:hypothetical protein
MLQLVDHQAWVALTDFPAIQIGVIAVKASMGTAALGLDPQLKDFLLVRFWIQYQVWRWEGGEVGKIRYPGVAHFAPISIVYSWDGFRMIQVLKQGGESSLPLKLHAEVDLRAGFHHLSREKGETGTSYYQWALDRELVDPGNEGGEMPEIKEGIMGLCGVHIAQPKSDQVRSETGDGFLYFRLSLKIGVEDINLVLVWKCGCDIG